MIENGYMQYYPGLPKPATIEHRWIEGMPHQVHIGYETSNASPIPIKAGRIIFHTGWRGIGRWRNAVTTPGEASVCHYIRNDIDLSESPVAREEMQHARD